MSENTPPSTGGEVKPIVKRVRVRPIVKKRKEATTLGIFFAGFILAMIIFLIFAYIRSSSTGKELETARNDVASFKVEADKAKADKAKAEKKQLDAEEELKKHPSQTPPTNTLVGNTSSTATCCAIQCCNPPAKKSVQRVVAKSQPQSQQIIVTPKQNVVIVKKVEKDTVDLWKFRFPDSSEKNPLPCAVEKLTGEQKPVFCSKLDVVTPKQGETRPEWRGRVAEAYVLTDARPY